MAVVRGGDENHVELLGMLLEHLAPVGVGLGIFPLAFAEHVLVAVSVDFREGNTMQAVLVACAMGKAHVCVGPPAGCHEADLQLAVLVLGTDQGREAHRGSRCGRGAILDKLSAIHTIPSLVG